MTTPAFLGFYCDHFVLPLPPGHRFPMEKYSRLRTTVLASGLITPENLREPPAATWRQLARAHSQAYINRVAEGKLTTQEVRRIGFPWSPQLVERSRRSTGGTIAACRAALRHGSSVNLAGGTHHAGPDWGQGFCVFNDAAVAARAVQAEGLARRVVILDCDVHQGNGTAAIFGADPTVFTFSIHGEKNFPFHKVAGDMDIGLPDGAGDEAYLEALAAGLRAVADSTSPDLAIYLAGADPYHDDRFGRLSLTQQGLAERDRLVYETCQRAGWPVATVMAGGYAPTIEDIVAIHVETVRQAGRQIGYAAPSAYVQDARTRGERRPGA
jgi:acetoin utilization deacetylase AcuC-like enzyme